MLEGLDKFNHLKTTECGVISKYKLLSQTHLATAVETKKSCLVV